MSGREERIMEATGELLAEQFEKSSAETVLICERKSSQLAGSFLDALGKVFEKDTVGKEEERGGEAQYLLFSYLHSSIFLKRYLIQIELMGKEMYGSEPLAAACWDAGNIYGLFERDVEELKGMVRKRVPRIKEYETDYIRYVYAPYYHRMAKAFIREMLEAVLEGRQVSPGDRQEEKKMRILFGEYMGEADILFTTERESFYEIFQDICR
ncbi:MAG: hypothetical protein K2N15_10990 [Lachnospiraceae bacterium]|nr:hypothetical protein [Lachnospiraceae bacterium]